MAPNQFTARNPSSAWAVGRARGQTQGVAGSGAARLRSAAGNCCARNGRQPYGISVGRLGKGGLTTGSGPRAVRGQISADACAGSLFSRTGWSAVCPRPARVSFRCPTGGKWGRTAGVQRVGSPGGCGGLHAPPRLAVGPRTKLETLPVRFASGVPMRHGPPPSPAEAARCIVRRLDRSPALGAFPPSAKSLRCTRPTLTAVPPLILAVSCRWRTCGPAHRPHQEGARSKVGVHDLPALLGGWNAASCWTFRRRCPLRWRCRFLRKPSASLRPFAAPPGRRRGTVKVRPAATR
ncbi:hypothetical protein SAMN00790413_02623 [Deinococcus hopiensis KR-140]|uniref:Uncharacterized protein n=1 Tax=Deinococcus hopiensis KR-140 TaxID=695939 RepID=A0A1W1VPX6_9DEIO|nr:hypothetical protein SAMN00790413_02623 [Deinococcus hopiensis KR-140]